MLVAVTIRVTRSWVNWLSVAICSWYEMASPSGSVDVLHWNSTLLSMHSRLLVGADWVGADGALLVGGGGSGIAFDANNMGACPGTLTYNDLHKIQYLVTLGNGQEAVTCQPANGQVRLVNGKATLFCKTPRSTAGQAYKTPLKVELRYGYKNSIAQQVEIENLDFGRA